MSINNIFLIDNFDSFTYNIVHGFALAGVATKVCRADEVDLDDLEVNRPDLLVISPGPGGPNDAKVSMAAIRRFAGKIPIFGICLGMQCLAVAYGGIVEPGLEPVHGKTDKIIHNRCGVFQNLANPIEVARYHSLHVKKVPSCMEITAKNQNGIPMAIQHRWLRLAGVQFHPDSFLTVDGPAILKHVVRGNF